MFAKEQKIWDYCNPATAEDELPEQLPKPKRPKQPTRDEMRVDPGAKKQ
jgi:hypothetical protein